MCPNVLAAPTGTGSLEYETPPNISGNLRYEKLPNIYTGSLQA